MLKNIPRVLSPELVKVLMEMGHGDEIVLGDANFPSASVGQNAQVIRADGHGIPELLDAILTLMPLDRYVEKPVALMAVTSGDPYPPEIWEEYRQILQKHGENPQAMEEVERYAFYARAKKAWAVVATGESAAYGNILLKKGVIG